MADREKVIYSIERCISRVPDSCQDCGYDAEPYPKCEYMLFSDALELLKAQEPRIEITPGWISVKDRLPEEGVDVLVWETQGFAYCDMLKSGVWNIGADEGAIISHWMPLPEPPKGEKNNG